MKRKKSSQLLKKQKTFLSGFGAQPRKNKALTLVEVMLSLSIIALGIISGIQLMAQILASENTQTALSQWESRLMTARNEISAKTDSQLTAFLATGGNLTDANVNVIANSDPMANPYPNSATALTLNVLDSSGGISASVPMLKIKDGQ